MADLIELDLVVRDKGLKQSLTTVERLERQIVKAAKAVDQNRISQDRYNKVLLQAKREYQTLGVSSQKATAEVRKFAAAQSGATKTTNMLTGAVKKQTEAQMAATKNSNRMGVVTQQAGYQISDFVVQVQSGTSAFVAFGQQASQLVGVLPLMAGSLGISAGAAIALSAALGIIIPIATALGAAFTRSAKSTEDASKATFDYKEATTSASSEIKNLTIESYMLSEGIESSTQAMLDFAIKTQEAKTAANDLANEASILFGPNGIFEKGGGFTILGFEIVKTDEEKLQVLRDQRQAVIEQTESLERQKNAKEILVGLEKAILAVKEQQKKVEEDTAAIQEGTYLSLRRRQQLAEAYLKGGEKAVKEEERLHSAMNLVAELQSEKYNLSKTEIDAILGQVKATYDLEDAVDAAKERLKEATEEAKLLANALNTAVTFSKNLDKSVDSLKARLAEARGEQGAVLALTVSQMEAEARSNAARIIAGNGDRLAAEAQLAIDLAQIKVFRDKTIELEEATKNTKKLGKATNELVDQALRLNEANDPLLKFNNGVAKLNKLMATGKLTQKAYNAEVAKLQDGLADSVPIIGQVSDAFADFVGRGFKDFKGFVNSVLDSFKNMLIKMIAMAARNKIMLSVGMGGSTLAGQAAAGQLPGVGAPVGGGMMGTFLGGFGTAGAAGTGLLGGVGASLGGFASGGLAGGFGAIGSAVSGVGAASGFMGTLGAVGTAIGAIAAPLLAVAAVISFFKKKVTELDSGLQGTITTLDATIESFKVIQTKRFWGLSKKVSTETEALDAEAAEPLLEAIRGIQQGVMDAAGAFGIASDVFDNFFYDFNVSLKGLTEEQQIEKVNEELAKMGDSFASLTGHFETMNELLEAANQRMQLQNRLDQLLGNNQAILTRQREAELSAMHELNRPLAQAIYDLEDANAAVANAFAGLRASIDKVISDLQSKLSVANEAVNRSRGIFNQLESALSGRYVSGDVASSFSRREGAMSFLRGGDFSDENKLKEALDVVSEPTEDLFGSFVDYARDFARTSLTLEEAKKVAEIQLTADEQQVMLLEQQIASAEAQYQTQVDQYNALMGIDTGVKSVAQAIVTLSASIAKLSAAQSAAKAAAAAGVGGGGGTGSSGGGSFAEQFGTGTQYKGYDLAALKGTTDLMKAANLAGVQTSGKTGAQIQRDIANATKMAIQLDKSTRAKQFAQGGYHTGGMRMVGERGPELEATGPSRIFSHNQTKGMFKDPELVAEVRSLRSEVSGLRSEQRQMQASNVKYVKRNYDINRKWDTDGLPATRT